MRNHLNRQRWAVSQRQQARAAYAAEENYTDTQEARLKMLREMAEMMQGQPHMARTLDAVNAEIKRLS